MTIHWIHTSDVHGHLDALQGVENHVNELRGKVGAANVILSDGGDCLQGSPLVCYHNYIDTDSPHIVAETMNRMHYDCVAVGNHDIEVGHSVYDRVFPQMNFPVLCANIKDYFNPYTIINKGGIRIAVLSFITPNTTKWISPSQYEGMKFLDVKECARYWIDYVKVHEQIDMLVGLFHIGWNDVKPLIEEIQDFDFVLYGHDHHARIERVGRTICAAPSSQATSFIHIQVTSASSQHQIDAQIIQNHSQSVSTISPPWGELEGASVDCDLNEFDSYFGPSSFLTLTHQLQLSATGAQISLAAPISYDAFIPRGPLTNLDVFKLYDRDSQLYTIKLTLDEIKGILEYSYSLWTNVMTSPEDHALLLDYVLDNGTRLGLKNFTINFLSAYGISYTVDLTQPYGQKITILPPTGVSIYNPSPSGERGGGPDSLFTVCLNSFHANGGGDVLTQGTGLSHSQLLDRVIKVEPHDLRQCLANEIKRLGNIHLSNNHNWHFIPESWAQPALERDRTLLSH